MGLSRLEGFGVPSCFTGALLVFSAGCEHGGYDKGFRRAAQTCNSRLGFRVPFRF